jgi:hypothetical protein
VQRQPQRFAGSDIQHRQRVTLVAIREKRFNLFLQNRINRRKRLQRIAARAQQIQFDIGAGLLRAFYRHRAFDLSRKYFSQSLEPTNASNGIAVNGVTENSIKNGERAEKQKKGNSKNFFHYKSS